MRKFVIYCDRCKKEFEKWNHRKNEMLGIAEFEHEDGNQYLGEVKDLCESCYTSLENWWNVPGNAESEK